MFFWQFFPSLYFCPFFLMISKYRKIFDNIHHYIILAWFPFCPVGYFTYLCISDLLLFTVFTHYISPHHLFSFKQGTLEHVLHRSQGRNVSEKPSKATVRKYCIAREKHCKSIHEKNQHQTWHKVYMMCKENQLETDSNQKRSPSDELCETVRTV